MTPEERAEFEAYRAEKEKKAAEEARKKARVEYAELVDAEVIKAVEELESLSQQIKAAKEKELGKRRNHEGTCGGSPPPIVTRCHRANQGFARAPAP